MYYTDLTNPELIELIREDADNLPEARDNIDAILSFHKQHAHEKSSAQQARVAFLVLLEQQPDLLNQAAVVDFLINTVEPTDFDQLQWQTPERMVEFCEMLYSFRFPEQEISEEVRRHVRYLLRQALHHYEENEEWEALFTLVEVAPTSPMMGDIELRRLRHVARAYELRRIRRNRLILYSYLIIQVVLVIGIFPFLFIKAENGELQRQVEDLANVEIGDDGYRLFTYTDGLYWSVITAASIGYGDITPVTTTGKLIAGMLGTMGVITVGVIAGLVLKWITPRSLD